MLKKWTFRRLFSVVLVLLWQCTACDRNTKVLITLIAPRALFLLEHIKISNGYGLTELRDNNSASRKFAMKSYLQVIFQMNFLVSYAITYLCSTTHYKLLNIDLRKREGKATVIKWMSKKVVEWIQKSINYLQEWA